jgi:UDP-galactopyranose mutase
MTKRAVVVGAGLTGATAAHTLRLHGWDVAVYERRAWVGGNVRQSRYDDVVYDEYGPHIFHTNDHDVYDIVHRFLSPYDHYVQTELDADLRLSWPLQVAELKELPQWRRIEKELANRPTGLPPVSSASFEEYAVALMGKTLYRLFIEGYTRKQWGCDPSTLSAAFAPRRIDLRTDGDRRLFRGQRQGRLRANALVAHLLDGCQVSCDVELTAATVPEADGYVVTAPLDEFTGSTELLEWRHVEFNHVLRTTPHNHEVACLNHPGSTVPYTRTTSARLLSGKPANEFDVVTTEFPGHGVQAYPVLDQFGRNKALQAKLVDSLGGMIRNAVPAGRLASYVYIDMDQAVRQGLNAARKVLKGAE